MSPKELILIVRKHLEDNSFSELSSPLMYDADKLEQKVSFAIMEKCENGCQMKFIVTIEQTCPPVDIKY